VIDGFESLINAMPSECEFIEGVHNSWVTYKPTRGQVFTCALGITIYRYRVRYRYSTVLSSKWSNKTKV